MSIRYVSTHDSPDDPGGLIREVLDMGAEFSGPAEDILLSWTLRLGAETDASAAAGRLIAAYGLTEWPAPKNACGRLIELLHETAAADSRAAGRRRGGARGRRS